MNTRFSRRQFCAATAAALGAPVAPAAWAQAAEWPRAKAISLVVPFTAGGSVDFSARLLATALAEQLGQSVVVDNIAGAGGAIGVSRVVQAKPDGYTLVVGPDSPITLGRLINPAAFAYDPLQDLAPVGLLSRAPMVLVARPGLPADSLAELIALAHKAPGQYTYATSGIGTVLQLAMALLEEQAGIRLTHVPYRGGAQIATDVIGGQVDLAVLVASTAIGHVRAKRLKALGVSSAQRLPQLPDVPAFAELPSLKTYDMSTWTGLFAPAQTPASIVERLNQALNQALQTEPVQRQLSEQGASPGRGTAAQFGAFVRAEYARNQDIVRRARIQPN